MGVVGGHARRVRDRGPRSLRGRGLKLNWNNPKETMLEAALSRGDRVELRGFGAFSVKKREARVGRNPRTGEAVSVDEKWVPFFKAGKELRERLNSK